MFKKRIITPFIVTATHSHISGSVIAMGPRSQSDWQYARVSTNDQSAALQLDALHAGGSDKTFTERASGAQPDRAELKAALDYLRAADTLAVSTSSHASSGSSWKGRRSRQARDRPEGAHPGNRHRQPRRAVGVHVIAAVAEFERELTLERTHAGLAQALGGDAAGESRRWHRPRSSAPRPCLPIRPSPSRKSRSRSGCSRRRSTGISPVGAVR